MSTLENTQSESTQSSNAPDLPLPVLPVAEPAAVVRAGKRMAEEMEKTDPGKLEALQHGFLDELLGHSYRPRGESIKSGKALRKQYPRSRQGEWTVKKGRSEGTDLIFAQEEDRIQDLIPVRHERMAASAFAFYRASAVIMAADLATVPKTGIMVQTCGDAHISNFGMFQSPERNLIFDINDFDETLPGPWEWDLKRLLTSVEICGRDRGFTEKERAKAVLSAARTYRQSMRDFSKAGNLEVWYDHMDVEKLYNANKEAMGEEEAAAVHSAMKKAFSRNNDKAVSKLTETVNGQLRIISNPPLVVPVREMAQGSREEDLAWMARARAVYRMSLPRERRSLIDQYEIVDAARKVVGVGSVGTSDWIMLMQGREDGDYLVLQIKEAGESALERYVGKSQFLEHGRRVVEGQRAIQTAGDILLGWSRMAGDGGEPEDYYIRQLWDGKGSIDLENIGPDGLAGTADQCAWVLAHAHAKTGDRHAIAAYLGKSDSFDHAMLSFAQSYADQNQADYEVFLATM